MYVKLQTNQKHNHKMLKLQKLTFLLSNASKRLFCSEISSALQLKKRPVRKKKLVEEQVPGTYNVLAYSTAEEYNLDSLWDGLLAEGLYTPKRIDNYQDCIHAAANYKVQTEPREVFFFREGTLVMWNMSELESSNLLAFIRRHERERHNPHIVHQEAEVMKYKYQTNHSKVSTLDDSGTFILCKDAEKLLLDKYTFSNGIALSVKLGIWEAQLERYIDSIEDLTLDLKMGRKVRISQEEALRKHGELFALRHVINLSSDLLDVPDFYWDRDQLEALYLQISAYFSIARRTRVMNEKINHCVELIELLSSHLSDKHHVRLEWMIIVLIMVEVAFEMIHYADRYLV